METPCRTQTMSFEPLGTRQVQAAFDGGHITSDAGALLLLRDIDDHFHFIDLFARCFRDFRDPDLIELSRADLLKQRIFGLCLGYENLIDHDQLRCDPLRAVVVGKTDPLGQDRVRAQDRGKALAGKSTLNRLELTPVRANADSRYKKIVAHLDAMQEFFLEAFIPQQREPPTRLILDLDSTDFALHGQQLGRFFHGYYDTYCYLPLYIFCEDHPLLALLRPANIDDTVGVRKHLLRIVQHLRHQWPDVPILVRGDSHFGRDHLMRTCDELQVDYLFGLAQNSRLLKLLAKASTAAAQQYRQTGQTARVFADFTYQTRDSWNQARRVVGKAEQSAQGPNPRFVVAALTVAECATQRLYEVEHCGRGNMEKRLKEQQLMLFADRVSCAPMRANQVRLCLATVAYIVMRALREFGLGVPASGGAFEAVPALGNGQVRQLSQPGVSVVLVDVVTECSANLHAEIWDVLRLTGLPPWHSPTHL